MRQCNLSKLRKIESLCVQARGLKAGRHDYSILPFEEEMYFRPVHLMHLSRYRFHHWFLSTYCRLNEVRQIQNDRIIVSKKTNASGNFVLLAYTEVQMVIFATSVDGRILYIYVPSLIY